MNKNKRNTARGVGVYFLIFAVVLSIAWFYQGATLGTQETVKNIEFSEFVSKLADEQVRTVKITESSRRYEGELKDGSFFLTYAPTSYDMETVSQNFIIPQSGAGLTVKSVKPSSAAVWMSWLPTILLIGVMIFFWTSFMGANSAGGGNKGVMNFGKNRAHMLKDGDLKKITFDDVAGLDEEKAELEEVVDFLRSPKKYVELGARIPKGILLVGPPGTGKTYISKAVAGEAGVPFFSISGSDFVEMFVGVGASRVRDLFAEAKKNSPCIIFIDEIDAVGRRRGAGIGGGNDEREQTLNQLLVEMDGFGINEGIIILAATNRPDVLDPAILRPGRFDREVSIGIPDIKGREAIFKVHSKNKPLQEGIDLKVLARRTPGFTPADIENMMNEAALLTARREGSEIHMDDLEEAITRVIAGPQKKSRVISESEKKLTAYHEAGHAVVARCLPNADPVHQVTIMPRGRAGGFTMTLPKEDKYYMTKTDMEEQIKHLLGGRVAEQIILKDISTGASNDLERATSIARNMITKYGMSDKIGPINYSESDEVFLGKDFTSRKNFSESLASQIDVEIKAIIESAYKETEKILTENKDKLILIAEALLELETIDGTQFEQLFTKEKTLEEIAKDNEIQIKAKEESNKVEAEKRKAAEEAARKEAEEQLKRHLDKGKRVAVMGKDGRLTFQDLSLVNERQKKEEAAVEEESGEE
ncbi:MAG: ATP-dependent metallopeptidase FtsH/Yme1/Tma family protein [Clostridia bacterium]|nr:ATP-dependent metallopeptidase FtsH/Yme1/Tma family protein [Clostridia bacterium]